MQIDREDIRGALTSKGFREKQSKKHDAYFLYVEEAKTSVRTQLSRGANYKVYSGGLLSKVRRHLRLETNDEFRDFVDCLPNHQTYVGTLRKRNQIT